GAGGTIYYVDNPDADTPGTPVRQCFYTDLATYHANDAAFNATVFINTGLTADPNGVVFFGFRIGNNPAPAPLSTTNGGYARLGPDGVGTFAFARDLTGNAAAGKVPHNCSPALSNDGLTLYVVARDYTEEYSTLNYLIGLDSIGLRRRFVVSLRGP